MALKLNQDGSYTHPVTGEVYDQSQLTTIRTGDAESGFETVVVLKPNAVPLSLRATYPTPQSGAGAAWVPEQITYENVSTGAEGGSFGFEPENLIRSYWAQVLPQLGYIGSLDIHSPEFVAAVHQFRTQGYDIVRNPEKTQAGSKNITEYGFRLPTGELASTWERKAGAWYEQAAPYIGLVLPGILGMAGITAGSLGASVTGQTSNALLNNAVGGAIIGGAKELITSGGDVESAIKGALTGGALGAAAELAQPYIKDAANALSQLTGDEVAQLAEADVTATDVAGDLGGVDVGAGDWYDQSFIGDELLSPTTQDNLYASLSDYGRTVYDGELALGSTPEMAYIRAARAETLNFPTTGNALATGGTAATGNALATDQTPFTQEDLSPNVGGAIDFTQGAAVTSPTGIVVPVNAGGVSDMLSTGMQEELGLTGAYTGGNAAADAALGLGAAGTAAGVAGAGAAAGAAGAADAAGAGTSAGAGGEMIDLGTDPMYGGAYTGSGAAESALTGATAGTTAATAGLTGIKVVDDFLSYLGTPAGAAALGAFGSLAGGYLTGQAAKDAAQIQADAAANALKLQREQFEYQKELLEPYRRRGESALNRLAGVMGLDGQPAQPQQLLEMDPGYAFRLGEGMKALERVQAARGNMLSGGAIKAGQRYAQDFASGEYGNAYNRLANIAGLGQTVGGQLGTAAQQFGQTAGETMSQGANALAAGRIGRTSGYMGGIGGAVGAYQNYQNQQQQNQLFRDIYGRLGV